MNHTGTEPGMRLSRWVGMCVLLALATVAVQKTQAGQAHELLWMCYPAAGLLCVGLLFRQSLLAATGGLFYLAIGLPYWFIDLVATRTTTVGSVALHLLAPIAGIFHIRQAGLQTTAKWLVLAVYLSLLPISRWLTPPALNINLAFGPYQAHQGAIPLWASYLCNTLFGLVLLLAVERLLRRVLVSHSSGRKTGPS